MVRLLLEMKAGLDTVLHDAFQRAETFGHALKDAFEHFINQRANRCASVPWTEWHSWRICPLLALDGIPLCIALPKLSPLTLREVYCHSMLHAAHFGYLPFFASAAQGETPAPSLFSDRAGRRSWWPSS